MLKKYLYFTSFLLCFVSFATQAAGYQYEAGVNYLDKDDNLLNTTRTVGSFRMYLQPVTYESRPYNEVAFLARQSNVQVSLGQLEYEIDLGPAGVDIDLTIIGVNLEYARAGNPFVFGLGFETAEGDEEFFAQDVDAKTDTVTVSAGYYVDPFTKIGLLISDTEVKIEFDTGTLGLDTNGYYVEYVTLEQLQGLKFYSVEARVGRVELEDIDLDLIQVAGNYYPDLSTNFGGALSFIFSDEENAEGHSVLLRAKHFIDPFTSVALGFEKFFSDGGSDGDSDTTRLEFIHRF